MRRLNVQGLKMLAAYDNANRLTTVTDPNNHLTTYAYDNANRLTSMTDRNNRQTTYSYDSANNKTGETWVGGSYIATYAFDAANRLTLEQDNFSKYILTYDNSNRLTNVDNNGTPNAPHVLLTYGYDNFNNRTSIADNFSATETLTYDGANNLTNLNTYQTGWANTNSVTLAYDTANRLTTITRKWGSKNGGYTQVQSTYGYDNADRLTGITDKIVSGSTLMTLTYGYDQANQLTSYAGPDGSITYGYDVDGQLTGTTGAHNETYTYDKEGNRTMTGYTAGTGNRLTADGTYTYAYDQDGNMTGRTKTSNGEITTFTWDFRNRLTEVLIKSSGGVTLQDDKFTYDIENRRIGKNTLSGGQSWTAYVDANPFMDFNSSGSLLYRYMYGNSIDFLIGRFDTSGNAMWYLTDKLSSVRENTDGSGNVLDSITYDTYGNILAETHPTSGDRFKYTSREWDSEIGQYFYRARYYSPTDGRFESEDPLAFGAGDLNLFRFVQNSPVDGTDPLPPGYYALQGLSYLLTGKPLPAPPRPAKPGGKPPPGAPGVGVPMPNGSLIYYPPQAYNVSSRKVAVIADNSCSEDRFTWIPSNQQHPGVGSYDQLTNILNGYDDHSIDVLVISGHGAGNCNVQTKHWASTDEALGGPLMPAEIYALIQRKLSANPPGQIVIAACQAGDSQDHMQATVVKCKLPVTATPGCCYWQHPGPQSAGGSADKPWITVAP